jgi:beta-lactamase superfamily II metal-dependent hydrolase
MFKLKIVQAEYGDCFLLEYGTGQQPRFILIDGGPQNIYKNNLRGELQAISAAGGKLDLVALSHVDEDHVLGLLDLFSELRRQAVQNEPQSLSICALWHNSFSETVGSRVENRVRSLIEDRGMSRSPLLPDEEFYADYEFRSIRQGDDLTHLARELEIPINPHFSPHQVICLEDIQEPVKLDNLSLTIIGPTRKNMERLRKQWVEWLNKRRKALQIKNPLEASRVVRALDRSIPNLSSIMFLAESDGKKILFTGDGRSDHILEGLKQANLLEPDGRLQVDIFKVPHHGSARNVTKKLFKRVTAGQYIISANGKHGNPDLKTLQMIAETAKEQNRQVEIVFTNETESIQNLLSTHPPDTYGYRLTILPNGAPAAIFDLETNQFSVVNPIGPSVQVTSVQTGGKPMSKKAFLVGINNFIRPSWALRGCINDTDEICSLLTTYFDFNNEDIKILHDHDATYEGIQQGLGWLLSDYTGSDVRVFHFSSHGSQVEDDGDDEIEALDEVLIPYDHSWTNPFRDDELHKIFEQIPEHVNFTFIADCCHSGSIQRALLDNQIDFKPRFITPPPEIAVGIQRRKMKREAEVDGIISTKLQEMLQNVPQSEWPTKIPEFVAYIRRRLEENRFAIVEYEKHVLLAGCEDRQTAADAFIEGMYRGAFTWGLSKAIRESNGNLTYEDLLRCASDNMAGFDQKPQLECPIELRGVKIFSPLV